MAFFSDIQYSGGVAPARHGVDVALPPDLLLYLSHWRRRCALFVSQLHQINFHLYFFDSLRLYRSLSLVRRRLSFSLSLVYFMYMLDFIHLCFLHFKELTLTIAFRPCIRGLTTHTQIPDKETNNKALNKILRHHHHHHRDDNNTDGRYFFIKNVFFFYICIFISKECRSDGNVCVRWEFFFFFL